MDAALAEQWARSCLRKSRYRTHWDALRVAEKCEAKRKVKLRHYRCQHCGGYHLTSKPEAEMPPAPPRQEALSP